MKVRSSRLKTNIEYDFNDFLLTEFSKDLETFVPDTEMSCSECKLKENIDRNIDSPLSFLIKFKADHLSDPRAVRGGAKGYHFPEDLNYKFERSNSNFSSISKNHYNAILNEKDVKPLARKIYGDQTKILFYEAKDVRQYMINSYHQSEWICLINKNDKKRWKKFVIQSLKIKLEEDYGSTKGDNLKRILKMDSKGFLKRISEIHSLSGFDQKEIKMFKNSGLLV